MPITPLVLRRLLGIELAPVSHLERQVSAFGGLLAILATYLISERALGAEGALFLVPSMGASAVLLFAVPHGALSQPWPLVGGHLLSAFAGVLCAKLIGPSAFAAATAVGLAIGIMYYLRCIHPPGGATALAAVIGGAQIHALGFWYLLDPVLLNVSVMLVMAVLVNYPFRWRRYPSALAPRPAASSPNQPPPIAHSDFVSALSQIDSYIDVSEDDLLRIYDLVTRGASGMGLEPEKIRLGSCYSNGEFGDKWAVRRVVDEARHADPDRDLLIYMGEAGPGRRVSGYITRREFARWARYRVVRDEQNWKRVE